MGQASWRAEQDTWFAWHRYVNVCNVALDSSDMRAICLSELFSKILHVYDSLIARACLDSGLVNMQIACQMHGMITNNNHHFNFTILYIGMPAACLLNCVPVYYGSTQHYTKEAPNLHSAMQYMFSLDLSSMTCRATTGAMEHQTVRHLLLLHPHSRTPGYTEQDRCSPAHAFMI